MHCRASLHSGLSWQSFCSMTTACSLGGWRCSTDLSCRSTYRPRPSNLNYSTKLHVTLTLYFVFSYETANLFLQKATPPVSPSSLSFALARFPCLGCLRGLFRLQITVGSRDTYLLSTRASPMPSPTHAMPALIPRVPLSGSPLGGCFVRCFNVCVCTTTMAK